MLRDHEPITVDRFRGTFDRGEDDVCPVDRFLDSLNVVYEEGGVSTRKGTSVDVSLSGIRRSAVYKRIGEASRLLLLDDTGKLWDSTSLVTPILDIPTMTDFSMVSLYNRAYITPHDGNRGLPGEFVYVYEGSGVAREAAGSPPSGFTLTAVDSAEAGSVEAGKHLFAVAYETSSGFITRPGPTVFTLYTAPGTKKVDVANIPIGPAGTIARHLLASKMLPTTYNGNQNEVELFFIPNGRIGDNTTTALTVNFYDADLISSADYIADELSTIPAGVGIGVYGSRLLVWGPDTDDSRVYASKAGEPESFDATEGFIKVFPGDGGGGVKNCIEFRGSIYFIKSQRTYTTRDNSDSAAFWTVPSSVDQSIGTEAHGVGKMFDLSGAALDMFLVADRSGLLLYNGTFAGNNLTFAIDDIWERVNKAAFQWVEVVVDPFKALIYIAVPLDAATRPSHVLVGDYTDGLSADLIKWTTWSFPKKPTSIVVDVNNTTKKAVFKFGSEEDDVLFYDPTVLNDSGTAINSYVQFALLPTADEDLLNHFGGMRVRAKGSGTLNITAETLDAAQSASVPSITLTAAPGRPLWRPMNMTAERLSVTLGVNSLGDWFKINKFQLFVKALWLSRPE